MLLDQRTDHRSRDRSAHAGTCGGDVVGVGALIEDGDIIERAAGAEHTEHLLAAIGPGMPKPDTSANDEIQPLTGSAFDQDDFTRFVGPGANVTGDLLDLRVW